MEATFQIHDGWRSVRFLGNLCVSALKKYIFWNMVPFFVITYFSLVSLKVVTP